VDELELVEGLRGRQEEAVAAFLERYRSLFFHCIGHFESDFSAREDLYQDLIMYALERLDRDRFDSSKGSLGTWLYRVAWCRCVDLQRKKHARRNPPLQPAGDRLPDHPDQAPGPGDVAGDEEISSMVRLAMSELEAEDRSLLGLRYIDGHTLGEISRELSISLEQAKYRLKRASTSLRRVLLNQFALEEATE